MENSGNKEMPQNPKPSDELQKHIETVVPDTEKEAVANANAAPEQAGSQESASTNKSEKPTDQNEAKSTANEEPQAEESTSSDQDDESNDDQSHSEGKDKDARDEIETVST